ncbi:MAG TPA: YqiA/YcfP family alpha/beta fold hydrolase [Kofleriaceae bacterium]|jgi:hypothetical protein
MAPRFLYLHGFASGPQSKKGVAFANHFHDVERLDLRQPSFEHLRLSAMIEHVREALHPTDRAVVVGSSLGGLTAARVAERDPRIGALVLLAPAFRIHERWRETLDVAAWQRTGWHEIHDFTTGQPARIDYGFLEDLAATDAGTPDVQVPTLILHGAHDDVVPIEHSRAFAAGKPHVHLVELADGHELVASLPTLLARAAEFLAPWIGARFANVSLP